MITYTVMPGDEEDKYWHLMKSKRWSFLTDLDEMLDLTIKKYEYCIEKQYYPYCCLFCEAGTNDMQEEYPYKHGIPMGVSECDFCDYFKYTGVSCNDDGSPYNEQDYPKILEQLKNMRADRAIDKERREYVNHSKGD